MCYDPSPKNNPDIVYQLGMIRNLTHQGCALIAQVKLPNGVPQYEIRVPEREGAIYTLQTVVCGQYIFKILGLRRSKSPKLRYLRTYVCARGSRVDSHLARQLVVVPVSNEVHIPKLIRPRAQTEAECPASVMLALQVRTPFRLSVVRIYIVICVNVYVRRVEK